MGPWCERGNGDVVVVEEESNDIVPLLRVQLLDAFRQMVSHGGANIAVCECVCQKCRVESHRDESSKRVGGRGEYVLSC